MRKHQGGDVRALDSQTLSATATCFQYHEYGRRTGLKIRSSQEGVGSSPTFGTKRKMRICWSLTPPRAAVSPPFRMRSGASQPHCRQAPYSPIRRPHGAFDAVIRPATNTMRPLGLISPIKPKPDQSGKRSVPSGVSGQSHPYQRNSGPGESRCCSCGSSVRSCCGSPSGNSPRRCSNCRHGSPGSSPS